MPDQINTH